ncbi:8-amino-7-oxononanoate synthase [Thalassotalea sp. HSM 43]|uniref:aminotransferase class I/II-fold pyridoxal phosphate-dependent enzyme n=1 Tax=Thalassotalea sp. HSM 43 TaxID=2552945 RepID=UPI001080C37F|nr:8-amino-7-oxononanoate synthase [Thalassotalea sp. HSM 43]QBY06032.1 8-amino-7-oxononanoate synthase [Thalassotalea sp. HSM 43]
MAFHFIENALLQLHKQGRYRQTTTVANNVGRLITIDDQALLNFSSNDYLGIASNSDVKQAFIDVVNSHGSGSGSASLISGFSSIHAQLQERIADWLGHPKALLFNSGFAANSGVLHALGQPQCDYFLDKLSHASLIDGAFLSKAQSKRFLHNDIERLQTLLSRSTADSKTVVVEGVYSMDGDIAPCTEITALCQQHGANVYVDDAHGIGVLGPQGSGTLNHLGVNKTADVIEVITFGKALGTQGAALVASEDVIDFVTNHSREYIYSTAMPAALAAATLKSIEICQSQHWRREKLQQLTRDFKQKLDSDITLTDSDSAIIGVLCGSEENALYCQQALLERGFFVKAIRPPTVENGKSRLRVTINANHNDNDINELAKHINEVLGSCLTK